MNKITLAGRLTKDVELADMGSSVLAKTSIAVNERKKKGDEWVDEPMFIDLDMWGKRGEILAKFAGKGSFIVVNGRLEIRKYERKDGTGTGTGISVKVDDFTFGPKNENKNSASGGFGNSDAPF